MKYGVSTYTEYSTQKEFQQIILETVEDVLIYKAINEQIKAKQAVGFWMGFKTNTFYDDPCDYASHQIESDNGIARVMSTALSLGGSGLGQNTNSKVSMLDYCNVADIFINNIHANMLEYVNKGKLVRVGFLGGYCSITKDDLKECHTLIEINEQQLYNFLLTKELDTEFKITSNTIVIENGNYLPKKLIETYCNIKKINPEKLQVITGFKQKTLLYKTADWVKFFQNGYRDHKLKNIVFETTGEDLSQIRNMKSLLESLNLKLNIYIMISNYAIKKNIHEFQTNSPNLQIHLLER